MNYSAATFQERGATLPVTTPMLAGARVRKSDRHGIELVVPDASGGCGFYVLRPSAVSTYCKPTVHDTMLFRRLVNSAEIDPVAVREAALSIALEGYAGRDAIAAAEATLQADHAQRGRTHILLATRFMEQVDTTTTTTTPARVQMRGFDQRLEMVLRRIAPSLGCPAVQIAKTLTAISKAFAPIGIAPDDRDARLVRLLNRLGQAADHLSNWLAAAPTNDIGGLGSAVALAMRATCDSARSVLRTTRRMAANPMALVKRWNDGSDALMTHVMRCDWLLDGWERIASLWGLARTDGPRRAALLEMPLLVPEPPREVAGWTIDTPMPNAAMDLLWRVTSLDNAWRTGGAAFALIERNEKNTRHERLRP